MPCWQQMAPQCRWGEPNPVAKATWTGARLALYARGGTKEDTACIKQLNITF